MSIIIKKRKTLMKKKSNKGKVNVRRVPEKKNNDGKISRKIKMIVKRRTDTDEHNYKEVKDKYGEEKAMRARWL